MNAKLERSQRRSTLLPDLFDWMESGFPALAGMRTMTGLHGIRIEEQQTEDAYCLRAELPGIDPDRDVEITIDGDLLTLRAERSERTEEKRRSEFRYGSFARSVQLPAGAQGEEAKAEYENGILTITVPTPQKKPESRTVKVRRAES